MYSIQVNISGYTTLEQVSFNSCLLVKYRHDESDRIRKRVDGNIVFYGNAYDLLKEQKDAEVIYLEAKIFVEDEEFCTVDLMLDGDWKEKSKQCELSTEPNDEYTKVLKNIEKEEWGTWDFPIVDDVVVKVNAEQVNMFQMRSVSISGGVNDPLTTDEWGWCSDAGTGNINGFTTGVQYRRVDEIVQDPSGSHDGYQSLNENIATSFCWVIDSNLDKAYYAAKRDSKNLRPPLTPHVPDNNWEFVGSGAFFDNAYYMGQQTSEMFFTNSVYDTDRKLYVAAGCTGSYQIDTYLSGMELRDALDDVLFEADPSIVFFLFNYFPYVSQNYPELLNTIIYQNQYKNSTDNNGFNLTLEDLFGIYKTLFNADWRLEEPIEGQFELFFRHESELPVMPGSYEDDEYQYIDRVFAKDWSSESFSYNIKHKVNKETFQIGSNEENGLFGLQVIEYANNVDTVIDYSNTKFETDLGHFSSDPNEANKYCIVQYDDDKVVAVGIDVLDGKYYYNVELSTNTVINRFYDDGRPFSNGFLYSEGYKGFGSNRTFVRAYYNECEINVPLNNPDKVDFDKYIITSYGNLKVLEIITAMNTASSVIKAAKQ